MCLTAAQSASTVGWRSVSVEADHQPDVDPSASVVCTVTPVTERQFGGEPAAEADDADGIIAMVGDQEPAPILIRVPAY